MANRYRLATAVTVAHTSKLEADSLLPAVRVVDQMIYMQHRIVSALAIAIIGLGSLALTSCGDYRAVSSRHHMSHYQTSYDSEIKELPWRPPALGDVHYPRSGNDNYLPGQAKEIDFSQDTHPDQAWRAGSMYLRGYPSVKH